MKNSSYVCEDCSFIFQVYALRMKGQKQFFCPKCGENMAVIEYQAERNIPGKRQKIIYTDYEIDLIHQCIKGKLRPFQAAMMMGRPTNAVSKKIARERERIGKNKKQFRAIND